MSQHRKQDEKYLQEARDHARALKLPDEAVDLLLRISEHLHAGDEVPADGTNVQADVTERDPATEPSDR
jgi:hypothetical protein